MKTSNDLKPHELSDRCLTGTRRVRETERRFQRTLPPPTFDDTDIPSEINAQVFGSMVLVSKFQLTFDIYVSAKLPHLCIDATPDEDSSRGFKCLSLESFSGKLRSEEERCTRTYRLLRRR